MDLRLSCTAPAPLLELGHRQCQELGYEGDRKRGCKRKRLFCTSHRLKCLLVSLLPRTEPNRTGPTAAAREEPGRARGDRPPRRWFAGSAPGGEAGCALLTLGNYFISPADGVSHAREHRPLRGERRPRPPRGPRAAAAPRRALPPAAGNLRDSPAARPASAAAPPPLGAGPSLRSTGRSLAELRGPSDVPALCPHCARRGPAGEGERCGRRSASSRAPRPLLGGQPHNHALPKFKSPRHCGSARSVPLRAAPSGRTGLTGGAGPRPPRSGTGHSADLPGPDRGETPPGPHRAGDGG